MKAQEQAPDGGWGWAVVVAAFIGTAISAGSHYSFGVLYVAFLDAFGQSKAETAWISGIYGVVYVLSTSHGIALSRRFGHRKTVMGAGVLASTGILASSFTTQLYQVYITYGIMTGIGLGLVYVVCIEMVSIYFKRRFAVAIGLAMAGSGAGQIFISIVAQILVDHYGWRGMMLILSGITSHLLIAGALLRPLTLQHSSGQKLNNAEAASTTEEYEYAKKNSKMNAIMTDLTESHEILSDQNQTKQSQSDSKTPKTCSSSLKSYFMSAYDFSLFKNPVFVVLTFIGVGQSCAISTSGVHLVRRARDYGIPNTQSAYIPAVMGLGQMIGRPFFAALSHIPKLNPSIPFAVAMSSCGIFLIISIYAKSFTAQVIFIIIYGVCFGGFVVYIPIVMRYFLGNDKIGHGVPILFHVQGICALFFSPLGGWIRDTTNVYDGTFWLSGVAITIAAVLALLLPVTDRMVQSKRQKVELESDGGAKSFLSETLVVSEYTTAL